MFSDFCYIKADRKKSYGEGIVLKSFWSDSDADARAKHYFNYLLLGLYYLLIDKTFKK